MPVRIYRPRAVLELTIPVSQDLGDLARRLLASTTREEAQAIVTEVNEGDFDAFTYMIPVRSAHWTQNDYAQADTLSVTVDWIDAGVDPRWIAGATCEFYLGNADENDQWEPTDRDLRFVGRLVKPARKCDGDQLSVDLEFHDYTSFFLQAKPFASAGVPLFTDDLRQAWARICEHTPGCEELGDNIEFLGVDAIPKLGDAVAERFRKAGKLQVSPNTDAWAVWQQAVGAAGLLSYMDLDQCIVTTATDYFTADDPPTFVWGKNLLSFSEQRNNDFALKPVGLTSFDPLTGKTIEVIHDPQRKTIKIGARKKKSKKPPKIKTDFSQVDFFPYPGVTDEAALRKIAEAIYEVRSRQAMEGSLTTVDMEGPTLQDNAMDLLQLGPGDTIDVRFMDSADAEFVKRFDSRQRRAEWLESKGYASSVAEIIAANVESLTDKSSLFYVKSVEVEAQFTGDGSYRMTINYLNKIDPSTATVANR